jgi:peptidyl-prolyl cis-trans isomerase D
MDAIEIDEEALRNLYEARAERYRQPERALLERLVFGTQEAAEEALAAIEAGETDFDTLLAERDLTPEDADLGEVARGDLPETAADAIFTDDPAEVVGPFQTALGPALYRVNAVLSATETPFAEARGELREELADDAARREIAAMREEVDDLLAAGATLEELAETTPLELGTIDYRPGAEDGIAAYDAFREAAAAAEPGDFPEVRDLSDGGLFALRLEEIVPPAVPPLAEIGDEVAEAWRSRVRREALSARAEELVAQIATGATLEGMGDVRQEEDVRRQDFLADVPPTLVAQGFRLENPGDVVAIPGARAAYILRLDAVTAASRNAPDTQALLGLVDQAVAQSMAQDIFEGYGQALQRDAGITLDQSVINAVHAQFN